CLMYIIFVWLWWSVLVFFFFQAEDGIRDRNVTGVQTCALPISCRVGPGRRWHRQSPDSNAREGSLPTSKRSRAARCRPRRREIRSEERRVGKECRCWWSTYHYKKKYRVTLRRG